MRESIFSRTWAAAVLAGAFSLSAITAVHGQQPTPSLRLVSETPAPSAQPQIAPVAPMSAQELREISIDAYVYAYPLVLQEVTRRIATSGSATGDGRAPVNQFGHKIAFPSADTPHAAWPNFDLLYSNLWFDVSREPIFVRIPDTGGRYYFAPIFDAWTDQFASLGPRTTGGGEQQVLIVGPQWQGQAPANVTVLRSPTNVGWLSVRIQANARDDIAAVNQLQSSLTATPYSQWAGAQPQPAPGFDAQGRRLPPNAMQGHGGAAWTPQPLPPAQQPQPVWDTKTPAAEQVARMDANTFFTIFAEAARINPPHANDYPMLERLRRIGLDPHGTVPFANLNPQVQESLALSAPLAGERIHTAVSRAGVNANGWRTVLHGIGTYGTDYTQRAAIAYAGLGANTVDDALYPVAHVDSDGEMLRGDEDYVLHFKKDELPPVNAFWSLNLYNAENGYTRNEANRHSIGSRDALRYNADGSLTIYISHDAPRGERRANWLPSPKEGAFSLNLRLYWPRAEAVDGKWVPPVVRRD